MCLSDLPSLFDKQIALPPSCMSHLVITGITESYIFRKSTSGGNIKDMVSKAIFEKLGKPVSFVYASGGFYAYLNEIIFPMTGYPPKYGLFGKHNGNSRIWHFGLLEMAWNQPQMSILTLMQLPRVVFGTKSIISVSEIKATKYNLPEYIVIHIWSQISHNF